MSIVLFQGEISQISTRKDRTVKIVVESAMELNDPDELSKLFSLKANTVYVAIKESDFKKEDTDAIPEPEMDVGEKRPGVRLRGSLFRLWEQQGRHGDFEIYYKTSMERLINNVKEKLT